MLITSFRLLYSRNALMWVGILLPPAAVKGEVSCRTIVLFGTKSREHPTAYDFRESFQRKGLYFHPLLTSRNPPEQRTPFGAVTKEDYKVL